MIEHKLLTAAMVLAGLSFATASSAATVTGVTGIWSSAVNSNGGSVAGVGTSELSWGVPAGYGYSGYSFVSSSVPFSPVPESQFTFGTFVHRNFPVYPPSLSSAVLDLSIAVDIDGTGYTLSASYLFEHEETPNTAGTCPAGSVTVCDDIVKFSAITDSFDTVMVDGVEYTFLLDNFVTAAGDPVSEFMTWEGYSNQALLVGRFTSEIPTPAPVPLPASLPLLAAGLGLFGAIRARRKAA